MTKLTDEEMEYRDQMGYAGTPDHWMREAHAALRAERQRAEADRRLLERCRDAWLGRPGRIGLLTRDLDARLGKGGEGD